MIHEANGNGAHKPQRNQRIKENAHNLYELLKEVVQDIESGNMGTLTPSQQEWLTEAQELLEKIEEGT
jgi:hypothetical protein